MASASFGAVCGRHCAITAPMWGAFLLLFHVGLAGAFASEPGGAVVILQVGEGPAAERAQRVAMELALAVDDRAVRVEPVDGHFGALPLSRQLALVQEQVDDGVSAVAWLDVSDGLALQVVTLDDDQAVVRRVVAPAEDTSEAELALLARELLVATWMVQRASVPAPPAPEPEPEPEPVPLIVWTDTWRLRAAVTVTVTADGEAGSDPRPGLRLGSGLRLAGPLWLGASVEARAASLDRAEAAAFELVAGMGAGMGSRLGPLLLGPLVRGELEARWTRFEASDALHGHVLPRVRPGLSVTGRGGWRWVVELSAGWSPIVERYVDGEGSVLAATGHVDVQLLVGIDRVFAR